MARERKVDESLLWVALLTITKTAECRALRATTKYEVFLFSNKQVSIYWKLKSLSENRSPGNSASVRTASLSDVDKLIQKRFCNLSYVYRTREDFTCVV